MDEIIIDYDATHRNEKTKEIEGHSEGLSSKSARAARVHSEIFWTETSKSNRIKGGTGCIDEGPGCCSYVPSIALTRTICIRLVQ